MEAAPCALYAFLHCCDKSFEELIPYAISLGGDTDTIASMAGAIGGAFWGEAGIPKEWIDSCESSDHAQSLGDELFDIVMVQLKEEGPMGEGVDPLPKEEEGPKKEGVDPLPKEEEGPKKEGVDPLAKEEEGPKEEGVDLLLVETPPPQTAQSKP